jgi:hypothetical protein
LLHKSEQINTQQVWVVPEICTAQLEAESKAVLILGTPCGSWGHDLHQQNIFSFSPHYTYPMSKYHKENKQGCVVTLWPCHLHLIIFEGKGRIMEIQIFHQEKL